MTSRHLLLAGTTGELIAEMEKGSDVSDIILSPTMSDRTQWVRVKIDLCKIPILDKMFSLIWQSCFLGLQGLLLVAALPVLEAILPELGKTRPALPFS